jgi:dihydrodipicolinate synthase/N-acetylneuraminate lyase
MDIDSVRLKLLQGIVIPACPLPLMQDRTWSERHQRALTRYYVNSGVGGIAVGVHSTQFAIRDPKFDLFEPVLESVSKEIDSMGNRSIVKIAGICGQTQQAMIEAETALRNGYHAGLLSLTALRGQSESKIIDHCRIVSESIPVIGFYLQPAVGGQVLSHRFWRQFSEIANVVAIKIAPFNRYQSWDVVRAVIETGRDEIALYTGNDDNIIIDLLTRFVGTVHGVRRQRFINGGLLGQWGIWTSRAVNMLDELKIERLRPSIDSKWLTENIALTDANGAVFDAGNGFAGCIPGIMEVLRRSGMSPSSACLDPNETLSPGQSAELDRVNSSYPHLNDNEFVAAHLDEWFA